MRRGAVYFVRFRIPADLAAKIGMAELSRSLHTSYPAEARKRCLGATVWFRTEIARLRRMSSPSRADLKTAALAYFAELATDLDNERNFPVERMEEEIRWNIQCSTDRIRELDVHLTGNNFDARTKSRADELAKTGGWALEHLSSSEKIFAYQLAARAEREQMQLLIHMLSQPHLDYSTQDPLFKNQPELPRALKRTSHQHLPSGLTVREAVVNYIARQTARNLGKSQIEELSRALTWLREEIGDATILSSIEPAELRTFRDDIVRLDVTMRGVPGSFQNRLTNVSDRQVRSVTARRYWRSVQTFFAWCAAEQLSPSDPAAGLRLDMRRGESSRTPPPFTKAELERLFKTPLYAGYQSPRRVATVGLCHQREGHWWSGVLFLFTGLRAGELSQLLPDDFVFDAEVPHLKIRETDAEGRRVKSTKNVASVRDVPLAPQLLQLGLRTFVERRREISQKTRVFREFRLGTKGRTSDGLTKFWAAYLRRFGLWKEGRSTHVFRHTVVACLRFNDVALEDIAAFVGHTGNTVTAGYGGAYPLSRKLRTAERLIYGLDVVSALGGEYDSKKHDW